MAMDTDALDTQFPYYLTEDQKKGLKGAIRDFNEAKSVSYYQLGFDDEMLQGDIWQNFFLLNYPDGRRINVKGIVFSNSCDISAENAREIPQRIMFAPLVSLENYIQRLQQEGMNDRAIDDRLQAIRNQSVTNIFYLPENNEIGFRECIIALDDVHSIPKHVALDIEDFDKVTTLSMFGFYMFVFKLSIHFCRLHENVGRD